MVLFFQSDLEDIVIGQGNCRPYLAQSHLWKGQVGALLKEHGLITTLRQPGRKFILPVRYAAGKRGRYLGPG